MLPWQAMRAVHRLQEATRSAWRGGRGFISTELFGMRGAARQQTDRDGRGQCRGDGSGADRQRGAPGGNGPVVPALPSHRDQEQRHGADWLHADGAHQTVGLSIS